MLFPDHLYVERLVKRLEASGNRTCLRHRGRDVAAGDLLNSIHRYARTLDSFSIGRGDVVALLAPNHPGHAVATPLLLLPRDTISLTSQDKPDGTVLTAPPNCAGRR